jgi:hypothetical protein
MKKVSQAERCEFAMEPFVPMHKVVLCSVCFVRVFFLSGGGGRQRELVLAARAGPIRALPTRRAPHACYKPRHALPRLHANAAKGTGISKIDFYYIPVRMSVSRYQVSVDPSVGVSIPKFTWADNSRGAR